MPIDRTVLRKTVTVYANSLLEAVKADGRVFEVSGQLDSATKIVRGNMELKAHLSDSTLSAEVRAKIAKEVFADFDKSVTATLAVLVERDDLELLARVAEEYSYLAEDELDAVFIDVTTVVALDDALRGSIKDKYSAQFGKKIMLREHIDASLVGGVVLSTHGKKVDASVLTQLDKARIALAASI